MKKMLLVWVLLLVGCLSAYTQSNRALTGTVRDVKGEAIPGVSILEKGSRSGAITDQYGNYRINVGTNATLVFSYVGFLKKEVAVGNNSTLSVVLEEDTKTLNEVVVTGFGIKQETRKLAYAVQEVKGQDLIRTNNANVVNSLQGKVAGVHIDQGTGGPMSSSRIRIRGNASLGGNTQPLFVIDGVLIRPGTSGADSWGAAQDMGNIMKNINSDNIESMTVLKGSGASALYGSEALNGVIVIQTKKGRVQKGLGVTYNHTSSFEKAYRFLDLQNEFGAGISPTFPKGADGVDEVERVSNAWVYSYGPRLQGQMVRDMDGRMIPWVANNPLDFFQTGNYTNHNVAVEGGTESTTFRAAFSRLNNSTIMPSGTELKRNNFNLRATQKIGKIFTLDATVDYTDNNLLNPTRQGGNFNPVFRLVFGRPRSFDINYWANNYVDPVAGGRRQGVNDPYNLTSFFWETFERDEFQNEKVFRTNLDLTANIAPWLNLLVRGNVQNQLTKAETKNRGDGPRFSGNDLYQTRTLDDSQYRLQAVLSANRTFGDNLQVNLSAGAETNRLLGGRNYRTWTDGGLRLPEIYSLANARTRVEISTSPVAAKRTDAIYLYGDLTYKDFLTFNFSNRMDFSSTLTYADGSGDFSYYYPSVGVSYIVTESLKNLPAWLSFGKLRGSLGYTGADTNPWSLNRTGIYSPGGVYNFPTGSIQRSGFSDNTLPNYNLRNRLAREWELGFDARFFGNRLGVDFTVYNKLTTNEILSIPVTSEAGVGSRIINAGKIQNKGIELMITATPIKSKDVRWNTSLNITRNRNKILELTEGISSYQLDLAFGADMASVARVGKDYGTIVTSYAFATYQKKDASGNPIDNPSNGKRVIGSVSGGSGGYLGFMRSGAYGQGEKEIGSIMERMLLSNINTVSYKNFTLNLQVDSKIGGMMASATHQYGSQSGNFSRSLFGRNKELGGIEFTDAQGVKREDGIIPDGVMADGFKVTKDGQTIDLGGMSYAEAVQKGYLTPIPARNYYENLTQWSSGIREFSTFENSWVSMREISVGYDVPAKFVNKIKFQSLRLSVVGRNLGYLYRTAPDGINPEGLKSNRPGEFAEYGGLPFSRNIGVTLNAGF